MGCLPSLRTGVKKERVAGLKKAIKRWFKPLLSRFVQAASDRTALLEATVEKCAASEPLLEIFEHILMQLYEVELLPQEPILEWAEAAEEEDEGSDERKCLAKATNMINWLKEDDEETEEESD